MKKAIAICTAAAMTLAMGTFTSSYVSAQENDTTFDSLTSTGTYDKYFGAEEGDVSISDVLNIDPEKINWKLKRVAPFPFLRCVESSAQITIY